MDYLDSEETERLQATSDHCSCSETHPTTRRHWRIGGKGENRRGEEYAQFVIWLIVYEPYLSISLNND